ncbi:MAG: hypothetical protein R3F53_19290 [Gammaproteobacteria bacterium]
MRMVFFYQWLEGKDELPSLQNFIPIKWKKAVPAVKTYLQERIAASVVSAANEKANEYCLFTAQPIPEGFLVEDGLKLEILVLKPAFSGRDNCREGLNDKNIRQLVQFPRRVHLTYKNSRSNTRVKKN